MKKILIVGGAGFIGSNINKMVHLAGFETIVIDNLYNGYKSNVTRGTFIEGDISLVEQVFTQHKIEGVIHFAGYIDLRESMQHPAKYYQNNVGGTLHLLDAMIRHNVKKIVFSSSAAVYGVPETIPIPETHPCNPINPYGATKHMVENILKDYEAAYGLSHCCLRYFNAAGGDPDGEVRILRKRECNLIPLILQGDGSITLFGTDYPTFDGTCIRDYVHVYDLGSAHIASLRHLLDGGASCCYNLGNGQGFSILEVIHAIEKVTHRKIKVIEGSRRPGDPPVLVADSQKIRQELGWLPRYPDLGKIIRDADRCRACI